MVYLFTCTISIVVTELEGEVENTSTHAGPEMRIIAIAALPEAEERAKIVSSEGRRVSCCWRV
jgi:hypothetical protein